MDAYSLGARITYEILHLYVLHQYFHSADTLMPIPKLVTYALTPDLSAKIDVLSCQAQHTGSQISRN